MMTISRDSWYKTYGVHPWELLDHDLGQGYYVYAFDEDTVTLARGVSC